MTFFQKNVHSVLSFSSNTIINGTVAHQDSHLFHHHHQDPTIKSALFPPPPPPFSSGGGDSLTMKRDPGGIRFLDDVGGSVDGLMSCTESLGFESSDERRVDDQIESLNYDMSNSTLTGNNSRWKREHVKREVKKFPPPLSSLDQNGKPTFFLRPVRKDGKLELQEVQINRPEILCASRQDGRLRLHLITSDDDEDFQEEEEEGSEEKYITEEIDQEDVQEMIETELGQEEEGLQGYTEEEDEGVEVWQIPVSPGGGDGGFRRCHDQVKHHKHGHHHHHHDFHVWRQHCVTIR